ncbi:MAG: ABC transporter permease [Thermotogae bacterium]|nr:ABC transporter permease [Thermotogota bacterium]
MSEMRKFISVLRLFFLDFSRDKITVFFTLAFPIILLLIFGSFSNDNEFQKYKVGLFSTESEKITFLKEELEKTGMWEIRIYESIEPLIDDVKEGKVTMGIKVKGKEVDLIYKAGDISRIGSMNTLSETVESILERKMNNVKDVIKVEKKKLSVRGKNVSSSAYTLAGTIAISLLSNGMFSIIGLMSDTRKKMVKKFRTTPVNPTSFMNAMVLTRLVVALIASFIMLMLAKYMLGIKYRLELLQFVTIGLSSTLAMMALGVLFIVIFKSAKAAENFATIFMTIVMFFTGVYFPISFLPGWLRRIADYIPVKYVAQGIRYSLGVEKMGVWFFWNINLWFFVFGVILLWLSSRIFFKPE